MGLFLGRYWMCRAINGFWLLFLSLCFAMCSPVQGLEIQAAAPVSVDPSRSFRPLVLNDRTAHYSLISRSHSSGFFPVSEVLNVGQNMAELSLLRTGELLPNFNEHRRYWFYTHLSNGASSEDWVLHISNFGYASLRVLVVSEHGQVLKEFSKKTVDINALGRAINLDLRRHSEYSIVIELQAEHRIWRPYIALLTQDQYRSWKAKIDLAFQLAVGIILGLILIGLVSWSLIRDSVLITASLSALAMLAFYLEHSSIPATFWQYEYDRGLIFYSLASLKLFLLTAFAACFLQVTKRSAMLYRMYAGTLVFTVLAYLFLFVFSTYGAEYIYLINYILVWSVVLVSGLMKMLSHGRYYFVYIFGWLPIVLSFVHVAYVILAVGEAEALGPSYKLLEIFYIQIVHIMIHAVAFGWRIKTLREEKKKAELLARAKSRFIVQSSHDFQQPISSMNLFMAYLRPHIQSEKGIMLFNKLTRVHGQLALSFNTIMDFSKLEAGVVKPKIREFALSDMFFRLEDEFSIHAQDKKIKLVFHQSSLYALSDPILLEGMLKNLISNALKYTREGRVVVGCRRRGLIQVLDTGCGIAEEEQAHLFDIYKRSELWSDVAGSGVGLAVVKNFADLMGHGISLRSSTNAGSCFSISLPLLPKHGLSCPSVVNDNSRTTIVMSK